MVRKSLLLILTALCFAGSQAMDEKADQTDTTFKDPLDVQTPPLTSSAYATLGKNTLGNEPAATNPWAKRTQTNSSENLSPKNKKWAKKKVNRRKGDKPDKDSPLFSPEKTKLSAAVEEDESQIDPTTTQQPQQVDLSTQNIPAPQQAPVKLLSRIEIEKLQAEAFSQAPTNKPAAIIDPRPVKNKVPARPFKNKADVKFAIQSYMQDDPRVSLDQIAELFIDADLQEEIFNLYNDPQVLLTLDKKYYQDKTYDVLSRFNDLQTWCFPSLALSQETIDAFQAGFKAQYPPASQSPEFITASQSSESTQEQPSLPSFENIQTIAPLSPEPSAAPKAVSSKDEGQTPDTVTQDLEKIEEELAQLESLESPESAPNPLTQPQEQAVEAPEVKKMCKIAERLICDGKIDADSVEYLKQHASGQLKPELGNQLRAVIAPNDLQSQKNFNEFSKLYLENLFEVQESAQPEQTPDAVEIIVHAGAKVWPQIQAEAAEKAKAAVLTQTTSNLPESEHELDKNDTEDSAEIAISTEQDKLTSDPQLASSESIPPIFGVDKSETEDDEDVNPLEELMHKVSTIMIDTVLKPVAHKLADIHAPLALNIAQPVSSSNSFSELPIHLSPTPTDATSDETSSNSSNEESSSPPPSPGSEHTSPEMERKNIVAANLFDELPAVVEYSTKALIERASEYIIDQTVNLDGHCDPLKNATEDEKTQIAEELRNLIAASDRNSKLGESIRRFNTVAYYHLNRPDDMYDELNSPELIFAAAQRYIFSNSKLHLAKLQHCDILRRYYSLDIQDELFDKIYADVVPTNDKGVMHRFDQIADSCFPNLTLERKQELRAAIDSARVTALAQAQQTTPREEPLVLHNPTDTDIEKSNPLYDDSYSIHALTLLAQAYLNGNEQSVAQILAQKNQQTSLVALQVDKGLQTKFATQRILYKNVRKFSQANSERFNTFVRECLPLINSVAIEEEIRRGQAPVLKDSDVEHCQIPDQFLNQNDEEEPSYQIIELSEDDPFEQSYSEPQEEGDYSIVALQLLARAYLDNDEESIKLLKKNSPTSLAALKNDQRLQNNRHTQEMLYRAHRHARQIDLERFNTFVRECLPLINAASLEQEIVLRQLQQQDPGQSGGHQPPLRGRHNPEGPEESEHEKALRLAREYVFHNNATSLQEFASLGVSAKNTINGAAFRNTINALSNNKDQTAAKERYNNFSSNYLNKHTDLYNLNAGWSTSSKVFFTLAGITTVGAICYAYFASVDLAQPEQEQEEETTGQKSASDTQVI